MSDKKSNKGLIVFIVILVLALIAGIVQAVLSFIGTPPKAKIKPKNGGINPAPAFVRSFEKDTDKAFKNQKSAYIAKLVIEGTIQEANQTYNQAWLLKTIEGFKNDPNNKGIILTINSPGGAVYQSDELYLALMNYKKETERPVYAYLESLAASGGYYIACSADYIVANRNCLTGSIGVIAGQFIDLTGLMEKYGVKSTTIHAGRNKIMGSYEQPMTEEQRQIMQSVADECYDQFTDIVATSRNLTVAKVKELADGRIYTAKQAISNGLIDNVGDFDLCSSAMDRKEYDFADYEIITYKYEKTQNFYELLMGAVKDISKTASHSGQLPEAIEKVITPDVPFPAYYYELSGF